MPSLDTPPVSPLEKYGVIEVDAFCTGCFYNLHGQVVTIDDRLGFPICRCPECGKSHPAGTGVTASSVWIRRFATILLFSWVLAVLGSLIAFAVAMAGFDVTSIGPYEHGTWAAPDGRPASWAPGGGFVIDGTHIAVTNPVYLRQLYPWNAASDEPGPGLQITILICSVSLVLGLLAGILCVTLLWHWPRWRYWGAPLTSLLPAAFISIPFAIRPEYMLLRRQCIERIGTQAGFQCLGILIGVTFGRSISRTIIRSIIPPKPRQALAFLWLIDGKTVPGAAAISGKV